MRDLDGLKTLFPKGVQIARENVERVISVGQEVLGATVKTNEAIAELATTRSSPRRPGRPRQGAVAAAARRQAPLIRSQTPATSPSRRRCTRPGSPGCRAFLCPQHAGMLGPPHAPEHAMDGVKEAIARAPRTGLGIARPWLVALLACLLLSLPGCGFDLSASQPRSRYQASLERAFPDPRAQALAIAAERGDAAKSASSAARTAACRCSLAICCGSQKACAPCWRQAPIRMRGSRIRAQGSGPSTTAARAGRSVYLGILLDYGSDRHAQHNGEALLFTF